MKSSRRVLSVKPRLKRLIILGAVIFVVAMGNTVWGKVHPLHSNSLVGIATTTHDILATTKDLQKSFDSTQSSGKTTKTYLSYMKRLQQDCKDVVLYKDRLKDSPKSESFLQYANESALLCKDLSGLAEDSATIYESAHPLLVYNSHLKRYQTLPLVKDNVRNKHISDTRAAISQTSEYAKNTDYPTRAPELLKTLKSSIESSKDLGYFPALNSFQTQMLAERQQYWTAYGSLSDLQHSLTTQLSRYCGLLKDNGNPTSECKVSGR